MGEEMFWTKRPQPGNPLAVSQNTVERQVCPRLFQELPMSASLPRRDFLKSTLTASVAVTLPMQLALADEAKKPKLRIAVKYGMIQIAGSIEDKFNLIKKLGLQGVEVDSPSGLNKAEAKAAAEKTGIVIHGVIDSVHWRDTL